MTIDHAVLAQGNQGGPGAHTASIAIFAILTAAVIVAVASVVSRRWRRWAPRIIGLLAGGLLALYLVGRGIAEFWVVDYSNPASYQHAWGGPSLVGVFAVHSGPGLIIVIAAVVWLLRWRAQRKQQREIPRAQPSV